MAKGPNANCGRRGLRKLPPEAIAQAQDQTTATITRIMLTFVGLAVFCLLSLLTPDAALLIGGERVNVPFAGPVSFRGFIIIGPAILVVLRIYLQIYVEHYRRLEPIRRQLGAPSLPTVAPLQNALLGVFVGFVLYLLLPLTMLAFTWKAAVLPAWGTSLVAPTVAVIAWHLVLSVRWAWERALLAVAVAAMFAATVVSLFVSLERPLRRPANLFRADLSNQWLPYSELRGAHLEIANLSGANLGGAELADAALLQTNVAGANLWGANLKGADLWRATLENADLGSADLTGADLTEANLKGADLSFADLPGANLERANLAGANLEGANLKDTDFRHANLKSVKFSSIGALLSPVANLEGANLAGAELADADLMFVDLTGADLAEANLAGANLIGAELTQAQLNQACGDETTKLSKDLSVRSCSQ